MLVRLLAIALHQAVHGTSVLMDGAGGAIACIDMCLEMLSFSRT